MVSRTRSPSVSYRSPRSSAGQQGGSWSTDPSLNIQAPGSSTQGPPRSSEEDTGSISDPSAEPVVDDAAQGPLRFFDPHEFTPHPIQGMVARIEHDGTVVRVYGPPLHHTGQNDPEFPLLLQGDSRVAVPQIPYTCGNTQRAWKPKPTIYFFSRGRLGVKLSDAFYRRFDGIDERDRIPFDAGCRAITVRIHFLGYVSSTEVQRKLDRRAKGRGTKAKSMQLSAKDYKNPPSPVTKSKVVHEVSKRIAWHISDLEANSHLFPFDMADQQWRLGQGRMKFEHMIITGLINVSSGSWSPIICVE